MDDDESVFPTQGEMKTLEAELRAAMQHQRAAYERMMEIQAEVDALMERARILLERGESSEAGESPDVAADMDGSASPEAASAGSASAGSGSRGPASPDSAELDGVDPRDGAVGPKGSPHLPASAESSSSNGPANGRDALDTRGAAG